MTQHKDFRFSEDSRKEMLSGINTVTKSIVLTMGPSGRLVAIRQPNGGVDTTKDGITVAKACLPLKDRFQDMGARLVKSACQRSVEASGDGTTCTALLVASLCNESLRLVSAGHNPVHLKAGVDAAVTQVVKELEAISTPVSSPKEIEQVAIISSNGDLEIGSLLRQAFEKVGNSGIVTVEKSDSTSTRLEVVPGYRYDRGYISQHFANNEKLECVLSDARILITDVEINNVNTLVPIMEKVAATYPGKPLFIIAADVVAEALGTLVVNSLKKALIACATKPGGYGQRRVEMLEDLAKLTGATVVSDTVGLKLEQFDIAWLGGAEKIIVTAGSTTIVNGYGAAEVVEERVTQIRSQIESCGDDYDRKRQEERLAKLVGGVAVVYVGGYSDQEVGEKLYRYEDALGATKAAVEGGIVAGGGTALLRISQKLDPLAVAPELRYGLEIVKRAIQSPTKKIAENAGKEGLAIVLEVLRNPDVNFGYNAQTDKYEDLMVSGVVDPTKVVRCALQNAASVAGIVLTTDCMISDIEDETKSK
jgi:chaperonin GroEL